MDALFYRIAPLSVMLATPVDLLGDYSSVFLEEGEEGEEEGEDLDQYVTKCFHNAY